MSLTCILLARVNIFGNVHRAEAALADRLAEAEIVGRPDLLRIRHERRLRLVLLALLLDDTVAGRVVGGVGVVLLRLRRWR